MIAQLATLAICMLAANAGGAYPGVIKGAVLDGSHGEAPLAGADVVLRAGKDGVLLPVAEAKSDALGRFEFRDLPVDVDLTYVCGANRDGVHFPGPRVKLNSERTIARINVTSYAAVAHPSPLVAERHEIEIHMLPGVLEVSETMQVANPSEFAFVGQPSGVETPVTLRLSIPAGFQKVTFAQEFHGRHFEVAEEALCTSIPWPPGERTLKFTYRLPIEQHRQAFARKLDLPTRRVRVRVRGDGCQQVSANLPAELREDREAVFETIDALPQNHDVTVALTRLGVPWIVYGRWGAVAILALLTGTTAIFVLRRPPPNDVLDG